MATPDLTALDEETLRRVAARAALVRLEGRGRLARRACSTSMRARRRGRRRSRSRCSRRASRPGRTTSTSCCSASARRRGLDRGPRRRRRRRDGLRRVRRPRRRPRRLGRLLAEQRDGRRATTRRVELLLAARASSRPGPTRRCGAMGAEQSNSSVVFDDTLVLKVFRRLEAGDNPELEMLRFLTERGFPNIAELAGWIDYSGELMDATLGVAPALRRRRPRRLGARARRDRLGPRGVRRAHGATSAPSSGAMHTALASDPRRPGVRARGAEPGVDVAHHRDDRRADRAAVRRPAVGQPGARADRPPRRGGARPPVAARRTSASAGG